MKLEELLLIANWAVSQTRSIIPYSANLPNRKHQPLHRIIQLHLARHQASDPKQKQFFKEIADWHLDLSSDKQRYPLNDSLLWIESEKRYVHFKEICKILANLPLLNSKSRSDLEYTETCLIKALKYGIGNCGELALYAMFLLMEYPSDGSNDLPKIDQKILLERVSFPGNEEHSFLILNRDSKKDLTDVRQWNGDTIIIDAWTKEVYTKQQLFENKSAEECDYILQLLKNSKKEYPGDKYDVYIGDTFNAIIHSEKWNRKHDGSKPWRPARVIDVKSKPAFFAEKLPLMKRNYPSSHQAVFTDSTKIMADVKQGHQKFEKLKEIRQQFLTHPELLIFPSLSKNITNFQIDSKSLFGFGFLQRVITMIGKGRVVGATGNQLWVMLDGDDLVAGISIKGENDPILAFIGRVREDYDINSAIIKLFESKDEPLDTNSATLNSDFCLENEVNAYNESKEVEISPFSEDTFLDEDEDDCINEFFNFIEKFQQEIFNFDWKLKPFQGEWVTIEKAGLKNTYKVSATAKNLLDLIQKFNDNLDAKFISREKLVDCCVTTISAMKQSLNKGLNRDESYRFFHSQGEASRNKYATLLGSLKKIEYQYFGGNHKPVIR